MIVRYRFLLMAGLVLASLGLLVASAHADSAPKNDPATQQTITGVRNVGTAMWTWYKDQMASRPHREHAKPADPSTADFSLVPMISREDLAKILVPKYIASIPEKDGWGHPYEFRLNAQNLDADWMMAVRSSGSDGRFSGTAYKVSGFPPAETDRDITWLDGYFVTWPDRKK